MLVQHPGRFLTLIRFITFIALGVYFFTYFSSQTAALPTLDYCHLRITLACGHPCVLIRWAFPFFCFVLIPIQLGSFPPKTAAEADLLHCFIFSRKPPVRDAIIALWLHYRRWRHSGVRTSHIGCSVSIVAFAIPTCARFVYIFSSSCFHFFFSFL